MIWTWQLDLESSQQEQDVRHPEHLIMVNESLVFEHLGFIAAEDQVDGAVFEVDAGTAAGGTTTSLDGKTH